MKRTLLGLATVLAITLFLGCSQRTKAVVEGTITLDGKPIPAGAIQFFPLDGQGQSAGATFNAGRYRLESSPGVMRVVINAPTVVGQKKQDRSPNSPMVDDVQEGLPIRYSDLEQSELRATIERGKTNHVDFPLQSGGPMPPRSQF